MKKNILIIGAGIHGCFLAKYLSKFNINIFLIEKRDVYFAPVSNTSTWKKSSVSVTYQYNNPIEGIFRVFIGIGVIVFVLCCGLHLLVGGLHKWSNSHPGICILTHNFMSLSLSILISTLLNEENDRSHLGS